MDLQEEKQSRPKSLFQQILSIFSLGWIQALIQIYQSVQRFFKVDSPRGLYEVLEYNATLDLLDPNGKTAFFKKWQKVKFLQDNVIAFQDHSWGDGNVLADYQISPGVVVDRYLDGDRWNLLISLRETKSRGDVENFYMQTRLEGSFTKNDEWWQVEMYNETRWLKLSIFFPPKRHCRRAILVEKTTNRTAILDSSYFTTLPDGRQVLAWETKKSRRFETYTIKWTW